MFTISLQRRHYIRIGILLFTLLLFWQRITVGLTLAYTFIAFVFRPAPILGQGDGWDLENLVAPPDAPELVPRIIHQARLGDLKMKAKWIEANESCAALLPAPEWRFELWDTPRANAFVEENYPELLDTYLGYKQEIQRSNVIRYLILYKYGGMYFDLDVKCKVPLDFFTTVDWVSPPGVPTGLNNAFMAAAPGHPFLKHVIDNLKRYDLNWLSLYVTDMFSAGCHYISTMHATYQERDKVRVLPSGYKLGGLSVTPIFDHLGAASWHRGDAGVILFIGHVANWFFVPWKVITTTVFGISGLALCCRWRARRARRAEKAARGEDVELFDVEREMLLRGQQDQDEEEEGSSGSPPIRTHRRSRSQTEQERRNVLMRLWRESISTPGTDENATSAHHSGSPSSCVSSSESTLQDDDNLSDEKHEQLKERKLT